MGCLDLYLIKWPSGGCFFQEIWYCREILKLSVKLYKDCSKHTTAPPSNFPGLYPPLPQGFNMLNQKSCCYLSIIPNLALRTLCIMSDHQYNFYWSGIMGSWWEEKIQRPGEPGIWSLHFDYFCGLLDVCNHILRMYWSSEGKQTLTTNCKLPVNYVTILLLRSPRKFKGCH